jgi:hypothetical protein
MMWLFMTCLCVFNKHILCEVFYLTMMWLFMTCLCILCKHILWEVFCHIPRSAFCVSLYCCDHHPPPLPTHHLSLSLIQFNFWLSAVMVDSSIDAVPPIPASVVGESCESDPESYLFPALKERPRVSVCEYIYFLCTCILFFECGSVCDMLLLYCWVTKRFVHLVCHFCVESSSFFLLFQHPQESKFPTCQRHVVRLPRWQVRKSLSLWRERMEVNVPGTNQLNVHFVTNWVLVPMYQNTCYLNIKRNVMFRKYWHFPKSPPKEQCF